MMEEIRKVKITIYVDTNKTTYEETFKIQLFGIHSNHPVYYNSVSLLYIYKHYEP